MTFASLPPPHDDFVRLSGLFRAWEVSQVLEPDSQFLLEPEGSTDDGEPLFALYRRPLQLLPSTSSPSGEHDHE